MGTDIHPAVEVRRDGVWRYHRPTEECPNYYQWDVILPNGKVVHKRTANGERLRASWDRCKTVLPSAFTSRNYLKFAILADVRNGFARGTLRDPQALVPISTPRGIAPGISKQARARLTGDHSETWVSLAELFAYDFSGSLVEQGIVTEFEFLRHVITGIEPSGSFSFVTGQDSKVLTEEEFLILFDPRIDGSRGDRSKRYYVQHAWETPMSDAASDLADIIVYMGGLIPKGGTPDDVRLVMNFDS